ncbi:MAG: DnaJ domain-containing protein [Verrucomicrobia bacterium]|nr:DnaJ domain-containing protein [Verrucomicrobiota bacterium]
MNDELVDCYRILKVRPNAPAEEVKKAYRELVKVWHSERFPNDSKSQPEAQEKLKEINLAYDERLPKILTDHSPGPRAAALDQLPCPSKGARAPHGATQRGTGTQDRAPNCPSENWTKQKPRVPAASPSDGAWLGVVVFLATLVLLLLLASGSAGAQPPAKRPTEAEVRKLIQQEIDRLDREIATQEQFLKDVESKERRKEQELEAGRRNVERRLQEQEAAKERLRRQADPGYFPHRASRSEAQVATALWKAVELGARGEYMQQRCRQMRAYALRGKLDPRKGEEESAGRVILGSWARLKASLREALENRPDSGFEYWLRREGNTLTHVRVDRRSGARINGVIAEKTDFFLGTDGAYLEEMGLRMDDAHAIRVPSVHDVQSQFMQQAMTLDFGYEMDPETHQAVRYFSPQDLGWAVYDEVPFEDAQGFRIIDTTRNKFVPAATLAPVNPFTGCYIEYGLKVAKLEYWLYHPDPGRAGRRVYAWKATTESSEPVLDRQAAADLKARVRTVRTNDVILVHHDGWDVKLPVGTTYLANVKHVGSKEKVTLTVHGRPERLKPGAAYLPAGQTVTLVDLLDEDGERAPAIRAAIRGPKGTWYVREGEPIPAVRHLPSKERVEFGFDRYVDLEQDTAVTEDLRYAMKLSSGDIVPAIVEFAPAAKRAGE